MTPDRHFRPPPPAILLIVLAVLFTQAAATAAPPAQTASPEDLGPFGLTAAGTGWLAFGERLYHTDDNGASWTDITPALNGARIETAAFLESGPGWLIARDPQTGSLALFRTRSAGAAWDARPLGALDQAAAGSDAVHLFRLNEQSAWIVLKIAAGSNFSSGRLFGTSDGGLTWTELSMPIGEPVRFVDQRLGWTAGGAAGDQLYRTTDGGQTWEAVPLPGTDSAGQRIVRLKAPVFTDASTGLLPALVETENGLSLRVYRTRDAGVSWQPSGALEDIPQSSDLSFSAFGDGSYRVHLPNSSLLIRGDAAAGLVSETGADVLLDGIERVDMVSPDAGWARFTRGECGAAPPKQARTCEVESRLLATADGGRTWRTLPLPAADSGILTRRFDLPFKFAGEKAAPRAAAQDNLLTVTGQGFDKCEIASLSQMQGWWANSPYAVTNLYIGGSARACSNNALNATFLAGLQSQGWKFIPTWVGPQAYCTGYSSKMSSNPTTAYNQGVAQANAALNVAVNLGLAQPDGSGTVIYYDLEAYNTADADCRAAANSFISGWTAQIKALGSLAGVYGASCASDLTGISNLPVPPDVVWIAHWIYSSYNQNASVWNAACLSNSRWPNHQRLRQYSSPHNETWGGATFNVDSNVLDGAVTGVTSPDLIDFAVIGDYGLDGPAEAAVASLVDGWDPDFILTLGDNNYPSGSAATIDANIGKHYHEYIYPYTGAYGSGASVNRFFPSLGNHDWVAANAQPYLNYFSLPGNERYYDFVRGPVHFFVIDSDPHEPDGILSSSTQAAWLQLALSKSNDPWNVVYFHHPPYSSGSHGSTAEMQWPFQAWGADVVLSGHEHSYERLSIGGFPYLVNGLGGHSLYTFNAPLAGSQVRYNADYGALRAVASETYLHFQLINLDGTVIDTFALGVSPAPVNDEFDNASLVTDPVPFNDSLVVSGATQAGDDPAVPGCGLGKGYASVWYEYTPAADGLAAFDTFGSSYDTFLAAWTGPRGALTPVACNDDWDVSSSESALAFQAAAGVTYHIEVGHIEPPDAGDVLEFHASTPADVLLQAGGLEIQRPLPPNTTAVDAFNALVDGPLRVTSNNGLPVLPSQRVTSGDSYNELMGVPPGDFTTEYWFPWYDHGFPTVNGSSMRTWILVGNPDEALTADVDIYIGGALIDSYVIPPGDNITPRWIGLQGGPVRVVSDIPVFASQRVFTSPDNSFNETFGYPADQFTSEYWFPWYDSINMNAWLLAGNTSSSLTAEVDVYIGSTFMGGYDIPPDGTMIQSYPAVRDGPVRVVVTNGVDIVASEAALSGPAGSFTAYNEVIGYPFDQLDTEYHFPWYDHGYPGVSGSNMRTWILVGNPDGALTADVDIYIDGVLQGSYAVPPNSRITPRWIGLQDGPVRVVSDIPVLASQRVFTAPGNVFNEMMGYSASRLTTEYWFPWYDSVNMTNDILIARP